MIQMKEQQLANSREAELNATISQLRNKISSLESTLNIVKNDIEKSKIMLSEKDSKLIEIEQRSKLLRDSLRLIIETMPIQLIDSAELSLTNGELIQLINILPSELGPEFISEINPELKPIFEIQGRQVFEWKGKKYALVVVGVTNPDDCHGCHGTNFINLLKWSSNQWVLIEKINTYSNPSNGWGNFAELHKFVITGNESMVIIFEGFQSGQGTSYGSQVIYQSYNEHFQKVYEGLSFESDGANGGNIDNLFELSFIDNGNKFFDLIKTKKSYGKLVCSTVFKFNPTTQKYD
jgi:hypothetical protein